MLSIFRSEALFGHPVDAKAETLATSIEAACLYIYSNINSDHKEKICVIPRPVNLGLRLKTYDSCCYTLESKFSKNLFYVSSQSSLKF